MTKFNNEKARIKALRAIKEGMAEDYSEANVNTNLGNLFLEMKDAGMFDNVNSSCAGMLLAETLSKRKYTKR